MPVISCKCGQKMKVGNHLLGKMVACPKCDTRYQLRDPNAPMPPVANDFAFEDFSGPETPMVSPASQPRPAFAIPKARKKRSLKPLLPVAAVFFGIALFGGLGIVALKNVDFTTIDLNAMIGSPEAAAIEDQRELKPGDLPRIPLAVTSLPSRVAESAPFPLDDLYDAPPYESNAAPYYLQAFAEFDDEVSVCFPESEQAAIVAKGRQRKAEIDRLLQRSAGLLVDTESSERTSLLSQCADGFRKLKAAQSHPTCRFQYGLGIASIVPHLRPSRTVVQYLSLKTQSDLNRGDVTSAVENAIVALRLANDLRYGGSVCQVYAAALLKTIRLSILGPILRDKRLNERHCDDLLVAVRASQAMAVNGFDIGLRQDFLMTCVTIRNIESRAAEFDPTQTKKYWGDEFGGVQPSPGEIVLIGSRDPNVKEMINALNKTLNSADAHFFDREIELAGQYARTIYPSKGRGFQAESASIKNADQSILQANSRLAAMLVPAVNTAYIMDTECQTSLNACECLIAVAKYRVVNGKLPDSLELAIPGIERSTIPQDMFSNEPLRVKRSNRGFTLYSIGSDLKDDGGQFNVGDRSGLDGDYLYSL